MMETTWTKELESEGKIRRNSETEKRERMKGGLGDWVKGGVELLYSSTTMLILRESNRVAVADIITPGGVKRNPGLKNERSSSSAVGYWKKVDVYFGRNDVRLRDAHLKITGSFDNL